MASTQLTVETIPASVFVQEDGRSRVVDFAFEIHNGGAHDLELIGIEQDIYDASGALIQLRLVDENGAPVRADAEHGSRIGSGERRMIRNPLPELAPGMPLAALVYRFAFRTADGCVLHSTIWLSPSEGNATPRAPSPPPKTHADDEQQPIAASAPTSVVPSQPPELARDDEPLAPPTPRQLARAWFETLYELGLYATPSPDR